jgi:hypothetical protein
MCMCFREVCVCVCRWENEETGFCANVDKVLCVCMYMCLWGRKEEIGTCACIEIDVWYVCVPKCIERMEVDDNNKWCLHHFFNTRRVLPAPSLPACGLTRPRHTQTHTHTHTLSMEDVAQQTHRPPPQNDIYLSTLSPSLSICSFCLVFYLVDGRLHSAVRDEEETVEGFPLHR